MDIDVNGLKNVLFSSNENVEFIRQLNQALKYLIDHDNKFVSNAGSAPQTWECKWLNQPYKMSGYPKGYAVWMNSNTYEQLLAANRQTIESYVMNNSTLNSLYSSIDSSNIEAQNKFLINAAKGIASKDVSAIYCLGDISQKVQIRISTVDDNKTYPTDLCYWKDFFTYASYEDNVSAMVSAANDLMDDAIAEHLSQYHMIGIESSDLDGYVKKSPFQISSVQTQSFFDHNYCNEMTGFDYVVQQKTLADGSAWCKVWKSGYVEQGGFVDNIPGEELIPVRFMTTYNYPLGASFYQRDYSSYCGSYDIVNPLQANNRYVVTVTPILDRRVASPYPARPINIYGELLYGSVDVTNMSNAGFSIVNTDISRERFSKYSWHVCGYKVMTYSAQMFDGNVVVMSTAPLSAFGIDSNARLTSFINDNYNAAYIPSNVAQIASNVFYECTSLQTIVVPDSVRSIDYRSFYNTGIRGVVIPDSITSIPDQAFANCKSLVYVKTSDNVNFIGQQTFRGCSKLTNFTRFADSNPGHTFDKVGNRAFQDTSLKRINLSLRSAGIDNFWGDYCFADCKQLEEVNILSAGYLSKSMFSGCTSLTAVNFKNNHTSYVYPDVFLSCTSLTSIMLPSKLWYISEEMFKDCINLKYVKFNDYRKDNSAINLVQKNAFNGCMNLNSIEFPASLTSINQLEDACLCCCGLTSLTFHGIDASGFLQSNGELSSKLYQTGMFRLNHDCMINCGDGQQLKFVYNQSLTTDYVAPNDYNATAVDTTTVSNFKTAVNQYQTEGKWWYYNAPQLCAQAYSAQVPCLFIYSLLGCKPCQIYMEKIFNNTAFQNWARQQKFYLCGMEVNSQPYYSTQLAFCSNQLVPACLNFAKEDQGQTLDQVQPNAFGNKYRRWRVDGNLLNSDLTTPVLVFYYNTGNSGVKSFVHTFHNIDKEIDAWGLDGVIQCLKSLCLYYFDNNTLAGARYVVNAGKAFDIADYPLNSSSQSNSDIIVPTTETGVQLTTLQQVNSDIASRIGPSYCSGSTPYMINCAFDDVDYLDNAFPGINTLTTIEQVNNLVNTGDNARKKFKIGNSYYKFSLSTTNTMEVTGCGYGGEILTAGAVVWSITA